MNSLNVSERHAAPPNVGISVVILSLGRHASGATCDVSTSHGTSAARAESGLGPDREEFWLPLVQRTRQPYLGRWALPGGSLRAYQSLERSAYEALASTTDLHPRYLEQLYTFGDPRRSIGGLPMVSIVYWALVGGEDVDALREDEHVAWFPEHRLPPLAFDHREIIRYALQRLRSAVRYPYIATTLVGPSFTLPQLRGVYEAVLGRHIDPANFRRRMLASGQLEDTGRRWRSGRQRPAVIYRYAPDTAEVSEQEIGDLPLPTAMQEAIRNRTGERETAEVGERERSEQGTDMGFVGRGSGVGDGGAMAMGALMTTPHVPREHA